MIAKDRIRALLEQYITGTISRQDFDELHRALLSGTLGDETKEFMKTMLEEMELDENLHINGDRVYERLLDRPEFTGRTTVVHRNRKIVQLPWAAGLAALLCVAIGLVLYNINNGKWQEPIEHHIANDGSDLNDSLYNPVLRLADGTLVNLDSLVAGAVTTQGNTKVAFNGDQLVYINSDVTAGGEPVYNTVMIPKGKQYQIVLPDGSKVWLNTATSITYPVAFIGSQRMVEVTGEAYFEVAHDEQKPFVVKSAFQEVKVLGTSFNISCYEEDASTRTTLLEGRVQINNLQGEMAVLAPGEQSIVTEERNRVDVRPIDPEEVISWTKGLFVFNNERIADAMKKISRWYDVKVAFEDDMAGQRIGGTIARFDDINELMEALQAAGLLRYKMEGGAVIIMK